jgi:hypothetical protein
MTIAVISRTVELLKLCACRKSALAVYQQMLTAAHRNPRRYCGAPQGGAGGDEPLDRGSGVLLRLPPRPGPRRLGVTSRVPSCPGSCVPFVMSVLIPCWYHKLQRHLAPLALSLFFTQINELCSCSLLGFSFPTTPRTPSAGFRSRARSFGCCCT